MKNGKFGNYQRQIDRDAGNSFLWLKKNYVAIQKRHVKTWHAITVISFATGLVVAAIWASRAGLEMGSKASVQTATLFFSSPAVTVMQGDTFPINVLLNTGSNNVVVAKADIFYNSANFELIGNPDTNASAFAAGNTCTYNNKACEIVSVDKNAGKISITLAKPTPGVNADSGIMATLFFKALNVVSTNTEDIKLNFAGSGNYTDSDVIVDDGNGTDILATVQPLAVTVNAVVSQSPAPQVQTPVTTTESKKKKKKKKKKKSKSKGIRVANSPTKVKRLAVLVQSGSGFTKSGLVRLYFANGRGGYYPPKVVTADSKGRFTVAYKVNKPIGTYSWYAVDVKTGKKTKSASYKVK